MYHNNVVLNYNTILSLNNKKIGILMGTWNGMTYKTKSGFVLTDEMLETLGDACERGEYPGDVGKILVAPVGRPRVFPEEDLVTITFKVPRSYRDMIDTEAAKKKETRSGFLREVLAEYLPDA